MVNKSDYSSMHQINANTHQPLFILITRVGMGAVGFEPT